MGGVGSGNFGRRSNRLTTTAVPSVTIGGMLKAIEAAGVDDGRVPRWLDITEERGDRPDRNCVRIRISTTPQPSGGARVWFQCPRPRCDRRCTALYSAGRLGPTLACRVCHGLMYRSQRLGKGDRWDWRAEKLFARAGCAPEDECYRRPKGMHARRFNALIDQAEGFRDAAFGFALWKMRYIISGLVPAREPVAEPREWEDRDIRFPRRPLG